MEPLLFLAHRIPYPPNKGDKIRSYHLLRYLAGRYRVYLGCFVDAAEDMQHASVLRELCADACLVPIDPRLARLRSLKGLATGEALTLPYYRSAVMRAWVDRTVAAESIRKTIAFSSPMAQYVLHMPRMRTVVDLVDVDSAKWTSYASEHRWPMSAVYRREGERLLAFEREAVSCSSAAVLVTHAEVRLFNRVAPECSARMRAIGNGVDSDFFAPSSALTSPFPAGERVIVFTGAMDYWPNVDAVSWFAGEVLPLVAQRQPDVRFYVVGMNPTAAVRALESDRVVVTGTVDDVRPYLQHAAAVVAPLRVARGIQNKVLEAMSMARPVVVSQVAAEGLTASPGTEMEVADGPTQFAERILGVLDPARGDSIGRLARARVRTSYQWETTLARFGELLDPAPSEPRAADRSVSTDAFAIGQEP